ncbi:MAG: hypothetical protein LUH47_10315 [Clostridiales bacterium]|nr:hypothetical protein [Clostridiales bacterium]
MALFIIIGIAFIISILWVNRIDYAEAEERERKSEDESTDDFWGEYP